MWSESAISEIEDKSTDSFEDSKASSETDVNAAFKLFLVIWKRRKRGNEEIEFECDGGERRDWKIRV